MKNKFMAAVALVALATAASAVSAEAKTKKAKHVKAAPVAVAVAGPVFKGPAPESCDRLNRFVATGDFLDFVGDKCDITWNGITVFGNIDLGLGYQSHATNIDKTVPQGYAYELSRQNNRPGFLFAPGGLGYNQVGIKGAWDVLPDTKVIFNATTNFDPYTFALLDGPNSLQRNRTNLAYGVQPNFFSDSSRGGQAFNNELYAGLKHAQLGQLTFGRHTNAIADSFATLDPMKGALAFSPLGFSGSLAGGTTEAARLDNSLKYKNSYGPVYVGAVFTLGNSQGVVANRGYSWGVNAGGTYAGFTLDGSYEHTKDAINLGALSQAQFNALALAGQNTGLLVGTLSDNDAFTIGGKYTWTQWTGFVGYESIKQTNASDAGALAGGASTLAGANPVGGNYWDPNDYRYVVTAASTTGAFPATKYINLVWTGVSYAATDKLTLTGAYYHYSQNSFAPNIAANVTKQFGTYDVASGLAQYALNKRVQFYGGVSWQSATGGLAPTPAGGGNLASSGFLYHQNWTTVGGIKVTF
jgi:predicted porin